MITSNNSSTASTPYIIVYFITSSITFCIICLLFYYIYKHHRTIKNKSNEINSNGDINQMNSNGDLNNGWYNMYDYVDIYKSITSKKSGSFNDIENSFIKNTVIGIDNEDIL